MNKPPLYFIFLIVLTLCGSSVAQTPSIKAPAGAGFPIVRTADAMKWQQVRPGQESTALWGDRSTGPYGALNRFAAGFEDRRHFHTRDLRGLIISGTMVVQVRDDPSREVGSGSYIFLPGGTPHTHSCKAGVSCVIFVEQDGTGDSVPADSVK